MKPTGLKEWASNDNAIIKAPVESYQRAGFPVGQPPADFLNFVFNNLYGWVDYIDSQGSLGTGGMVHQHKTARPRIQLPFTLPAQDKSSSIEVWKRSEVSVGGVGTTEFVGAGRIEGGQSGGNFAYTGGETDLYSYTADNGVVRRGRFTFTGGLMRGPLGSDNAGVFPSAVAAGGSGSEVVLLRNQISSQGLDDVVLEDDHYPPPQEPKVLFSDGTIQNLILRGDDFPNNRSSVVKDIFRDEAGIYLAAANSEADFTAGRCIIWDLKTAYSSASLDEDHGKLEFDDITPVYKEVEVTTGLIYFRLIKSYSGSVEPAGSRTTSFSWTNAPSFGFSSYAYNPTDKTVKIILTGSVTATSFALFRIWVTYQDTEYFSASATDAVFDSSEKSFTWENVQNDPLQPPYGAVNFSFRAAGAGLPAFSFTKLNSGFSIEAYGGEDYLYVESGVSNDDLLFIRRVGT